LGGLKIKEIRYDSRRVNVEGTVTKKGEPREVNLRTGETARVADAILTDETGSITLSLWNDDIERVNEGDRIKIENGYVSTFRGEKRLNVGRYGKLTVIS
jgi:replication factor A1